MALERGQISIVVDGESEIVLEAEPFEWPAGAWSVLEVVMTERTGWVTLTADVVAALRALYNGAHGNMVETTKGLAVQYVEGTGPAQPFAVSDWRGNAAYAVFVPDEGLVLSEVQGTGDVGDPLGGGYWTGAMRLVLV